MSFFKVNHKAENPFDALPVGEYEAIITKAEFKTASSGNGMIALTLTIRDDYEQKGQKRKVFDNLVMTDNMVWKINQVLKVIGSPDGVEFETADELISAVIHQPVRIKLSQREWNGNKQNNVQEYKPTMKPGVEMVIEQGDGELNGGKPIEISESDVPF
jgi:hypothetical protein